VLLTTTYKPSKVMFHFLADMLDVSHLTVCHPPCPKSPCTTAHVHLPQDMICSYDRDRAPARACDSALSGCTWDGRYCRRLHASCGLTSAGGQVSEAQRSRLCRCSLRRSTTSAPASR
jgi:hypothetical protein